MREIEFRAFDDARKEMLPSVDIEELMTKGALVTNYKSFVENIRPYIMQYTGLLDKNGIKIFEGDIAEYEYYAGQCEIFTVVFEVPRFCFQSHSDLTNWNISYSDVTRIQVIGNKFENPELLGKDK